MAATVLVSVGSNVSFHEKSIAGLVFDVFGWLLAAWCSRPRAGHAGWRRRATRIGVVVALTTAGATPFVAFESPRVRLVVFAVILVGYAAALVAARLWWPRHVGAGT